nr:acyltransferase [Brevibacterium otitidis]
MHGESQPTLRRPHRAEAAARPRLPWIDTVRVAVTVLVIAHHCAVTYGNIPVWFYNEPPQDPSAYALDALVVLNQTWFMGLFFLISGYFVPVSVDRHGPRTFTRDRLIRLGLPLFGFVLIVRPHANFHSWLLDPDRPSYALHYLRTIDAGPAWFLEVLLVLSLIYAIYRAARGTPCPARDAASELRPGVAVGLLLALMAVMAATGAAWRLIVPDGTHWPVVGLPTPSFLPQYALMFAAGVLASRHRWLEHVPTSVAAMSAVLSALPLAVLAPGMMSPDPRVSAVAAGVLTAALGAGLSVVVLVIFRRLAPGTGPIQRFLSANAFTVYVIHPAILVGLALMLREVTAPAIAEFGVLFLLAVPACWLLAAVRTIPGVKKIM